MNFIFHLKKLTQLRFILLVSFSVFLLSCEDDEPGVLPEPEPEIDYRQQYVGQWNLNIYKYGYRYWENEFSSGSEQWDTLVSATTSLTLAELSNRIYSSYMDPLSNYGTVINTLIVEENGKILMDGGNFDFIEIGSFISSDSLSFQYYYSSDGGMSGGNVYQKAIIVTGSK
jgi:hypothetical protein